MILTRAFFLASLLSATLAVSAIGQTLPPGMTMHRLQAGEPDASGWMLAAATGGGVSGGLAPQVKDFTIAESRSESPPARFFVCCTQSAKGNQLPATRHVL